jgi:hypothetical protein
MEIERRDILKLGAGGALAAGALGALAGAGPAAAQAASTKVGGIHIHASLKQIEGPFGTFGRIVNATVYGTDDDLNGSGWDANPVEQGSHDPAAPDRTQCFWTARGSVDGDTVKLKGRNLFWQNAGDDGAPVVVEASLATGKIRWETTPHQGTFVFEGIGSVVRT